MRHAFHIASLAVLLLPGAALAQETGDDPGGEPTQLEQLEALAQPEPTRAEQLAAQAEAAFVDGNYAKAIDLLQQAYADSENPNMLYNIARVHEADGNLEQALEYYRQFVVAPGVDIDYRREALQSTEVLEQKIEAQRREELAASQEEQPPPTAGEQPELIYPAPFPTTSALRPLGFVLTGIGVATVATGAGLGLAALSKEKDFESAASLEERRQLGRSTRDLATAADAMYISGAVLIVTGVVTAFASPKRERQTPNRGLSLNFGADGLGAVWTQSF